MTNFTNHETIKAVYVVFVKSMNLGTKYDHDDLMNGDLDAVWSNLLMDGKHLFVDDELVTDVAEFLRRYNGKCWCKKLAEDVAQSILNIAYGFMVKRLNWF
jgi:hypothetical protein